MPTRAAKSYVERPKAPGPRRRATTCSEPRHQTRPLSRAQLDQLPPGIHYQTHPLHQATSIITLPRAHSAGFFGACRVKERCALRPVRRLNRSWADARVQPMKRTAKSLPSVSRGRMLRLVWRVVLAMVCPASIFAACSRHRTVDLAATGDASASPTRPQSAPVYDAGTEAETGTTSQMDYPSWPSPDPPEPACMQRASTQIERGACAGTDRDQAQRELDGVLDRVIHRWPDREFVRKVRAAQNAWLRYRDAELGACFPAANRQLMYGSSFSERWALEEARLLRARTRALRAYLSDDGERCP